MGAVAGRPRTMGEVTGAPASTEEGKAAGDLRRGGVLALVGALAALAAPVALELLARSRLYGLTIGDRRVVQLDGLLVVVGAVLVLLALVLYRRAFSHLKHVDRRLVSAAVLCLVGSAGAIALVGLGAYLAGGTSSVGGCLAGPTSHAFQCLRGHDPSAGYFALAAFWLAWLGAVGLSLGLVLSGRHLRSPPITAGGCLYAVLAADLLVPFVALVTPLPGAAYGLAIAPVAAVVAAGLVVAGGPSPHRPSS